MQCRLTVNYRSLTVEDETDSCPKTSITNCQSTLHNIPEERRPQLTLIHSVSLVWPAKCWVRGVTLNLKVEWEKYAACLGLAYTLGQW